MCGGGVRQPHADFGERHNHQATADAKVNAVDYSRSRAPTAYAEGVHQQPAQCPDSPRSTTGDTVGCLQQAPSPPTPSRLFFSLPEEGLWFSTSLLLILKFRLLACLPRVHDITCNLGCWQVNLGLATYSVLVWQAHGKVKHHHVV
ncbi:uncharacterized protein LOC119341967 isoform X1 [Triticum dicoccoides]|uniref:uncharacterized protein LOC119341967 isoform X1 n=2 Tax=Triticum dicoccoides TaxID=85692 RepID=UPI001891E6C2|nr:uncharacterized protein LOC119341967 isoform X1 [Triticum dicoccoides]